MKKRKRQIIDCQRRHGRHVPKQQLAENMLVGPIFPHNGRNPSRPFPFTAFPGCSLSHFHMYLYSKYTHFTGFPGHLSLSHFGVIFLFFLSLNDFYF